LVVKLVLSSGRWMTTWIARTFESDRCAMGPTWERGLGWSTHWIWRRILIAIASEVGLHMMKLNWRERVLSVSRTMAIHVHLNGKRRVH
jgi:hypothetical protein